MDYQAFVWAFIHSLISYTLQKWGLPVPCTEHKDSGGYVAGMSSFFFTIQPPSAYTQSGI